MGSDLASLARAQAQASATAGRVLNYLMDKWQVSKGAGCRVDEPVFLALVFSARGRTNVRVG